MKTKSKYTTKDIRDLLIDYLLKYSVRKEMLQLMVYIRDNEPTEHEIVQKALLLDAQ